MSQSIKVDSCHVTIRRAFKQPSQFIAANYGKNRWAREASIISMSNPACGFTNRFNLYRKLLA
jgi:hypothetical protein